MWDRVVEGMSTSFTRDRSGFLEFVEIIGSIPVNMVKPTIGRKDHTQGYVSGNIEWQSFFDNRSESATRNQVFMRKTPKERSELATRAVLVLVRYYGRYDA